MNVVNQLFSVGDYGVNHVEFLFIGVRNLLEEDNEVRKVFFNELMKSVNQIDNLDTPYDGLITDIDSDLLCYLAYTTHWPEFYEFVKCRKEVLNNQKKIRYSKDLSDVIQDALQPNWEDVDFYNNII